MGQVHEKLTRYPCLVNDHTESPRHTCLKHTLTYKVITRSTEYGVQYYCTFLETFAPQRVGNRYFDAKELH
jgi:hypothetical protein